MIFLPSPFQGFSLKCFGLRSMVKFHPFPLVPSQILRFEKFVDSSSVFKVSFPDIVV